MVKKVICQPLSFSDTRLPDDGEVVQGRKYVLGFGAWRGSLAVGRVKVNQRDYSFFSKWFSDFLQSPFIFSLSISRKKNVKLLC